MARIEGGWARAFLSMESATDLIDERAPRRDGRSSSAKGRERVLDSGAVALEVERLLNALPPSDERLLRMRFGIGEPSRDIAEVGRELGVSTVEARQWEDGALRRLRLLSNEASRAPSATRRETYSGSIVALPQCARSPASRG